MIVGRVNATDCSDSRFLQEKYMEPIQVVIAGLGPRGLNTYGNYQNLFPENMKVVGAADIDDEKLKLAQKSLSIDPSKCFHTAEEMFSVPKFAKVAVIATQDSQHIKHAVMAMKQGYDLLLEKPIANKLEDCLIIMNEALKLKRHVAVCHVLRYTTFYKTIKEIIDSGKIGEIASIDANENVGYWHQSHSFVRGNWRNAELSSPMILQKCCHDLDIFNFLTGKKCLVLSSYGSNMFFNSANKPQGAADYCLDCKYCDECAFSAKKIYLSENAMFEREWLCYVVAPPYPTKEKIKKALERGPYGRCVFACDNDVVDHQSVNMLYEGGATVHLTMSGFSEKCYRTIRITGTAGEVEGNQDTNIIRLIRFGEQPVYYDINKLATDLSGHGGGDNEMMTELMHKLASGGGDISSSIVNSIRSHIMAFAAEKSRLNNGETINIDDFIAENGGAIDKN